MGRRLDGINPLAYLGVKPITPPNLIFEFRAPTSKDYKGIELGTFWLWQVKIDGNPPTYTTSKFYMLAAKANNYGTWIGIQSSDVVEDDIVKVQSFVTPGTYTYTPSSGLTSLTVEVIGGGGGSGGAISMANNVCNATGGAGAGGYAKSFYTVGMIGGSVSVVVGAGGLLGAAGILGGTGGTSSFGALMSCSGGFGSQNLTSNTIPQPGGAGGIASGGNVVNVNGQTGGISFVYLGVNSVSVGVSGAGGGGPYGSGGFATANSTAGGIPGADRYDGYPGNPGFGYGSGASGSVSINDSLGINPNGANGTPGIVVISEFF